MISLNRGAGWLAAAVMSISLLLAAAPAPAQEISPDQVALARKYVDLTDKADIYGTTVAAMAGQTLGQILKLHPGIADQVTAAITDVVTTYKERKGELMDQIARVYAQNFTTDELNQIVAFYSSPTGQKLATDNFGINQQLTKVMQIYQLNLTNEFYAKVKAELKAKGVEL